MKAITVSEESIDVVCGGKVSIYVCTLSVAYPCEQGTIALMIVFNTRDYSTRRRDISQTQSNFELTVAS